MDCFTIKDLENLSGIKAHTIRIWEQRYQFLKPSRTVTNIRFYSSDELKKLLNIALLNKYGFKISHIDKMCETELREKILSLNQQQAQLERIVNDLIQCMIDLDLKKLEDILNSYIASKGIERTIVQLIFPFMEKIGVLWLTSHINPAQEHLVSNIIRQKLIVGIERADCVVKPNKTLLLFLPETEHHELGLLFLHYLLKSRGASVIYLGADIPVTDVEYVVKMKKPDYLFCHLTSVGHRFNFEKFLLSVTKHISTPFILSGTIVQTYQKKIPPSVTFIRSFKEAVAFISLL